MTYETMWMCLTEIKKNIVHANMSYNYHLQNISTAANISQDSIDKFTDISNCLHTEFGITYDNQTIECAGYNNYTDVNSTLSYRDCVQDLYTQVLNDQGLGLVNS
jgi:hypothetical protein